MPFTDLPPTSGHGQELSNLAKMYTDETKYSGKNDSFTYKLTIFHDICTRADVPHEAKAKAFPTMLKGLALDYYYSNINKRTTLMLDEICYAMRAYFEEAEYEKGLLSRWNGTTLKSVINRTENEGKSMEECLHLLIKDFRHLQHGLDSEFCSDNFIHNKLITACQEIPACQYACFKPSNTLAGLINDLQLSIVIFYKANSSETFFTDRHYYRHPSTQRPQPRSSYNRKKKCFVCDKEGCWSSKHTKDEREESKKRYKERIREHFSRHFDKQSAHYIADYERTESDSDNDLDNKIEALMIDVSSLTLPDPQTQSIKTFITSFGPLEHAKAITTDLENRSFKHTLGTNFDNPTTDLDSDSFAYIATDRYTPKEFYGIMVDSGASKHSTAGYRQYLAYEKDNKDVLLDTTKAGAVRELSECM